MKKWIVFALVFILFETAALSCAENKNTDKIIKNRLFSITIPKELIGIYEAEIKKDKISIYDKAAKKAGFGGFAFGIKAYKRPADHATLPGGKKIGELTDKEGTLYDMVIKYPTDVQFDYTKGTQAFLSYKPLYDLGENVVIKGINGSTYFENQGMKGENLYKDILKKHISAIKSKTDSKGLENQNMSYMYYVLSQRGINPMDKVGYAYYDVNGDGIDELFIGEISSGEWKGIVYDMYTMVDHKPQHVLSGGERNRYFVCDDGFICNEYSSGAYESGARVYTLVENSIELFPQVSFKYDGYSNKKKPWFISYGSEINNDKWDNVDEKTFNERKFIFERYKKFDYIPLQKLGF